MERHVRSYLLQIPPNARIHTLKTTIFQVLPWKVVRVLLDCSGCHFCVPIIPTIGAGQVRAAWRMSPLPLYAAHSLIHTFIHSYILKSQTFYQILKLDMVIKNVCSWNVSKKNSQSDQCSKGSTSRVVTEANTRTPALTSGVGCQENLQRGKGLWKRPAVSGTDRSMKD